MISLSIACGGGETTAEFEDAPLAIGVTGTAHGEVSVRLSGRDGCRGAEELVALTAASGAFSLRGDTAVDEPGRSAV